MNKRDKRIGFAHCIDTSVRKYNSTKYGDYIVGSTLSHQLLPLEHNIKVVTNIKPASVLNKSQYDFIQLPYELIDADSTLIGAD